MELKLCEASDLPALFELARLFHAEIGESVFLPFDDAKTAWHLDRALAKGLALGAEQDGALAGGLLLEDEAPRYSSALALFDIGFYVRPEFRRSRAAVLLRDGAKAIAADMGLPLFLAVSSGDDLDRKDKFFTRAGFRRVGALYLLR